MTVPAARASRLLTYELHISCQPGQSGGCVRVSGVSPQHTPATRIWFGRVSNEPGYRSLPHHHGEAETETETGGYMLSGTGRIWFGEHYERWIEMTEGDSGSRGGHHYQIVRGLVGGRHFGRNDIPVRARLVTYEQAWRVLGVTDQVTAYRRVLELSDELPLVRRWVAEHPLRALQTAGEWATVLAAFRWLDQARGTGKYLREITAPGVDTKFVERHRDLLAALLRVDRGATAFIAGLGLRAKPVTVLSGSRTRPCWLTSGFRPPARMR